MIPKRVSEDARIQANSIYHMNNPRAMGYLFTCRSDGSEVAEGMYCNSIEKADPGRWDGLYLFDDDVVYDITSPRTQAKLGIKAQDPLI